MIIMIFFPSLFIWFCLFWGSRSDVWAAGCNFSWGSRQQLLVAGCWQVPRVSPDGQLCPHPSGTTGSHESHESSWEHWSVTLSYAATPHGEVNVDPSRDKGSSFMDAGAIYFKASACKITQVWTVTGMTWWLVKKCSMKLLWSSEHAWVLPGSCECRQNEGYRVSQWLDVLCGSLGPDLGQFCAVPMAAEMLRYCSSDSGPLRSGFRWQCFRLQKNSSRPWGKAWCASWVCVVELTRATFDSQASWFQRVVLCLRLEQSCVDLWFLLPNFFNPHQACVWFGHSSGTLDFWAVGTNCCGTTGTPPLGCYTMLQSQLECVCVCGSVLCGFDAVKNRACASWQSVAVKVFLLWCSQPLCAIWPAGVGWHAYCAHLNQ